MSSYHANELNQVSPIDAPESPYKVQVKFTSEHGQTRWMSVDAVTFEAIRQALAAMDN